MSEIIREGRWAFEVTTRKMEYNGMVISHTIKLGGKYNDCVNISYKYQNGEPVSVSIPHLLYEPECDLHVDLEKGGGTVAMIRAAIKYAYSQVPSLTEFHFDDMSHIDCQEKDRAKPPPRKPKQPLNLAYFSIAYHGMTWYEANFNATMKDERAYAAYKQSLACLTDPGEKAPFLRFLELAQPPAEQHEALKGWYEGAKTYREFFQAIPKGVQCEILYPWLTNFLKDVVKFVEKGWVIDVTTMGHARQRGGGRTRRAMRAIRPFSYTPIHTVG